VGAFAGLAFGTAWYDQQVAPMLYGSKVDPEADRWFEVFDRLGVSHVLVTDSRQTSGLQNALQAAEAKRELRVGDVTLYRLEHGFAPAGLAGEPANVAMWSNFHKPDGPTITDVKVSLGCTTAKGASFDVRAYDDAGNLSGHRAVSTPCPSSGSVLLETRLFTGAAPSRVELETPVGVVQVAAGVRLRKDTVKSRSLAARVRAWDF
ncbi:MAG TPA: hypothetical protein VFR18_22135, partial [Terriglobia bacterium]|nr:hypothetical protein [Terriglobia bacterium]